MDAAGIDRCTQETSSELEGCGWVNPTLPPLPHGCDGLVQGTLPAGARCESSVECADGLHCKGMRPLAPGVCSAPSAARTSCEVPADNLSTLLRTRGDPRHPECQGRCVRGECLPFVEAGGACAASSTCAPGLNCIAGHAKNPLPRPVSRVRARPPATWDPTAAPGRCVALRTPASCSQPFECRGLACAKHGREVVCGAPAGPRFVRARSHWAGPPVRMRAEVARRRAARNHTRPARAIAVLKVLTPRSANQGDDPATDGG